MIKSSASFVVRTLGLKCLLLVCLANWTFGRILWELYSLEWIRNLWRHNHKNLSTTSVPSKDNIIKNIKAWQKTTLWRICVVPSVGRKPLSCRNFGVNVSLFICRNKLLWQKKVGLSMLWKKGSGLSVHSCLHSEKLWLSNHKHGNL